MPDAIPADERAGHFSLGERLFGLEMRGRRNLENGYEYVLDADLLEEVALWIARERLCCPFLDFRIGLAGGGGALRLSMTGPTGTQAFLDSELPVLPPRRMTAE